MQLILVPMALVVNAVLLLVCVVVVTVVIGKISEWWNRKC